MARSPRPLTTTAAPSSASASAIALPIFLPAPVTIATLPDSARAPAIAASCSPQNARPKSQANSFLSCHRAPRAVNHRARRLHSGSRIAIRDRALKRFKLRRRNRPPTVGAELQRDPNRCTPLGFRLPSEADEIRQSTPIAAADDRNSPSLGSHPASEERRFAPWRAGLPYRLAPRSSAARYGLAVIFAAAAYFAAILLEVGTGKFTALSVLCGRRRRGMARRRTGPVVLRAVFGRGGGFLDAGAIQTSRSPRSICRPLRRLSFSR